MEETKEEKTSTCERDQHIDHVLIVDRITLTHSIEYGRLKGKQNQRTSR